MPPKTGEFDYIGTTAEGRQLVRWSCEAQTFEQAAPDGALSKWMHVVPFGLLF